MSILSIQIEPSLSISYAFLVYRDFCEIPKEALCVNEDRSLLCVPQSSQSSAGFHKSRDYLGCACNHGEGIPPRSNTSLITLYLSGREDDPFKSNLPYRSHMPFLCAVSKLRRLSLKVAITWDVLVIIAKDASLFERSRLLDNSAALGMSRRCDHGH